MGLPDGAHLDDREDRREHAPRRGAAHRAGLDARKDGRATLSFWLTSEDLPHPDNRVTVDRDGRITLAYTPNNEEGHKRLVANLYVVDASFFPSSCAVNPALTIMANALRVGDHVRERLG